MHPNLQLVVWMCYPALELVLGAAMLWRKLHRKFPVFFAYVVFQLVNFAVIFPAHQYGSDSFYFYSYWAGTAISMGLGFKVIHEIFLDVFRPYHTLKDLGTVLFKWASLVMIFVALVVAVASPPGQSPIPLAVMSMQRCVRVIQCGLILFLLVFSRYLAVSWKQHSFGIACGFGFFAAAELAGSALYAGRLIGAEMLGLLTTISYGCAIVIWCGYALMPALSRQSTQSTGALVSQRWEQSLTDLQHPVPADSLIPMFEGMVDRAFSKNKEQSADIFMPETSRPTASSESLDGSLSLPR
ncbi:MAG: hypothetical protein JOZ80_07260 [Acidobacteriaceae bacterium]|nr:hypothetical protein [Acidobacteriaceae bacterium]